MKLLAQSQGALRESECSDFELIQSIVKKLPEIDFPQTRENHHGKVSCHHLAHAFGSIFEKWRVIDGYFGKIPHSWLETCDNMDHFWWFHKERSKIRILDIYPVAGYQPQLLDMHFLTPYRQIYIPRILVSSEINQTYLSPNTRTIRFFQEVEVIKNEIKKIIELGKI